MEEVKVPKKRILSGIQPSGDLHLGNYLAAVKNWIDMGEEYDCFYFMADLHTITVRQNPADLRRRTLEQLANRLADKVVRTKKPVRLEPMNPYERKVIHATLQSNPNVTTKSEGEEPYRRVIIELSK